MKLISTSMEEIKKSKFIGYLYELDSVDEVKVILDDISSKNKRARHIPYAYIYKSNKWKTKFNLCTFIFDLLSFLGKPFLIQ